MDSAAILNQLNDIFVDVLDNSKIKLTPTTVAKDIEEWDSLNHIQLVVAIEKKFKIRFTTPEINGWKQVGDIIACIENKLAK